MATQVVKASDITVQGVDLTTRATSVEMQVTVETAESIAMTENWFNTHAAAMRHQINATYLQDMATGSVDDTHWALTSAMSNFVVQILASGSTAAGDNPIYSGTYVLSEYQPIAGERGANMRTINAVYIGSGAPTRATS